MKLTAFEITGFRSYANKVKINIDSLSTFVGKNDAGKSSIMEALNAFFDEKYKLTGEDLCAYGSTEVVLTAEFQEFDDEIGLDTASITRFSEERLLYSIQRQEPTLRVTKKYRKNKAAEVYLEASCELPEDDPHPITLKHSQLKAKVKQLGLINEIEPKKSGENPPYRSAIWQTYSKNPLRNIEILVSDSEAKNVWQNITARLPIFFLFRVDRESSDQDSEVSDPLSAAISLAIGDCEEEIRSITAKVTERAAQLVQTALESIQMMVPDFQLELDADFNAVPKWTNFKAGLLRDRDIPFNLSGSGTKRLVLLSFFRADAEKRALEQGRNVIYAFEEPESSQHPSHQRILLENFLELADNEKAQVILTTHSPYIALDLPLDSLKLVRKNEFGDPTVSETIYSESKDVILEDIVSELGFFGAPPQSVKVIVFVEGVDDVRFLFGINRVLKETDSDVIQLEDDPRVVVVPVGGANLKNWKDVQYLQKLNCNEFHIYDRDCEGDETPKNQELVDDLNCRPGCKAVLTHRLEIENYFHPDVFLGLFQVKVEVGPFEKVPEAIVETAKIVNSSNYKSSTVKRKLSRHGVLMMTPERLIEHGVFDEIKGWFDDIAAFASDTKN